MQQICCLASLIAVCCRHSNVSAST